MAMAAPASAQAAGDQRTDDSLALLTAAVAERVTAAEARILVDPRPIIVRHFLSFPGADDFLEIDENGLEARAAAIRRGGVETTNVFPLREGCTPYLVPPDLRDRSSCPEQVEVALVFGLPEECEDGMWRLPMTSVGYTPRGRSVRTVDVFLVQYEGKWVVDRSVTRVVYD